MVQMKASKVAIARPRRTTNQRKTKATPFPKDETVSEDDALYQVNESVMGRLAGIGRAPQFGRGATLARIQEALECASRGEVYYSWAMNRDMIQNDSHIQAEIGKRIMSFMGQNETIEPYDKNDPQDVIAAEAIREMIENCDNWREGCLHLAQGHIWPIAGCEKIFEAVDPSSRKYKHPVRMRLKQLHPIPWELYTYKVSFWNLNVANGNNPQNGLTPSQTLTNSGATPIQDIQGPSALNLKGMTEARDNVLVWNADDWQADLRFYGVLGNGLIDWTLGNGYKPDPSVHVLHSANVATGSMPQFYPGLLGSLIFWWFLSAQGRDWFARAMERYASPFAVAYANTANKNVFDLLTKAFNQATKVNALIVPPQAKIELKEIQASGMADAYSRFIELCNTEKTKAILGQTLSTTSKGAGDRGGGVADLHSEVRSEWTIYDKRAFCEMERSQIFEQYLRINGFKGRAPRAVRGGITPANQAIMAKTLAALAQAGVFPDPENEQDLSAMFSVKLLVKDPVEMAQAMKPKDGKPNPNKEPGSSD
jgi:hypothetical protein